jgi:hypothetical protein
MSLLWLPDAIRHPIAGQPGFAWQVNCPPKGVLHTTEGGNGIPSYTPGLKAPHGTVVPKPGVGVDVHQHIPLDRASYSLMHDSGTAPTNGAHAFQWELAGTCDPSGPGYHWPTADDAVLRDLYAKVIKPLDDAFGIQLIAPPFKAYHGGVPPTSAGAGNGVRLSEQAWLAWNGWLGHEHAPGNVHGDPGAFPWGRLVQIANGDDDMPLTDDDAAKVAKAVFNLNVGADGVNWGIALQRLYNRPAVTAQDIAAAIVAQFKALPAGTATVDDATIAKVAQATATELATRLVR